MEIGRPNESMPTDLFSYRPLTVETNTMARTYPATGKNYP